MNSLPPLLVGFVLAELVGAAAFAESPLNKQWQVTPGDRVRNPLPGKVQAHTSGVGVIVFSADGSRFASAAWRDGGIKLWSSETGELLGTLPGLLDEDGSTTLEFLRFSRDGQSLFVGFKSGEVVRWSLKTNTAQLVAHFKFDAFRAPNLGISGDGRYLLKGQQHHVSVIDLEDNSSVELPIGEPTFERLLQADLSPDGNHLMMAYENRFSRMTLRLWQWRERRQLWSHQFDWNEPLRTAAFSADGTQVIAVVEHHLPSETNEIFSSVKIVGKLIFYDPATGKKQRSVVLDNFRDAWSFSADGNWLVTVSPRPDTGKFLDIKTLVYNATSGEHVASFSVRDFAGFATVGAISPEANLLVVGDTSGHLNVFRTKLPTDVEDQARPPAALLRKPAPTPAAR